MKFKQYYSGSSGNLYSVTALSGSRLIIDPGVPVKKLKKALNHNLSDIVGCLCSHAHKDHCKSLLDVACLGIETYALQETYSFLSVLEGRRINPLVYKEKETIGCFQVMTFKSNHDIPSCLFVIKADGEYLLFATDSSHIEQWFTYPFSIIAIECSYLMATLEKNLEEKKVDEHYASRLLSSHMEKAQTVSYIEDFCNLSKCVEIHLLHMSSLNINKKKTRDDFEKRFMVTTKIIGD